MVITKKTLPLPQPRHSRPLTSLMPNLNYTAMRKVCSMNPNAISRKYGLKYTSTKDGGYWFKDNGADILAVAHLDSVQAYTHFQPARLKQDTLIFCTVLDDRLGAYLILDYLPQIDGMKFDILLTTNEEKGTSTARDFEPPKGKNYKWMFMFDKDGTGCTPYTFRGTDWELALSDAGFHIRQGSYSCIKELEWIGCKGVNFGVGYHDNHGPEAFASRNEIIQQVRHFLQFYETNYTYHFPHTFVAVTPWKWDAKSKASYAVYPKRKVTQQVDSKAGQTNDKLARIEKWKKEKEVLAVQLAATKVQALAKSDYERKQTCLLMDIEVLPLPDRVLFKMYEHTNISVVGELMSLSRVELLNIPTFTKYDVEAIRKALDDWDLTLGDSPIKYNVSFKLHIPLIKPNSTIYQQKPQTNSDKVQLIPMTISNYDGPDRDVTPERHIEEPAKVKPLNESTQDQKMGVIRIRGALSIHKDDNTTLQKVGEEFVWVGPTTTGDGKEINVGFTKSNKEPKLTFVKGGKE